MARIDNLVFDDVLSVESAWSDCITLLLPAHHATAVSKMHYVGEVLVREDLNERREYDQMQLREVHQNEYNAQVQESPPLELRFTRVTFGMSPEPVKFFYGGKVFSNSTQTWPYRRT